MTTRAYPQTTGQQMERGWRFGWIDAVVILTIFVLLTGPLAFPVPASSER